MQPRKIEDGDYVLYLCHQCFCMTKHRNERCLKCGKKDFSLCTICDHEIIYRGSLGSMDLDGFFIEGKFVCSECAKKISKWYVGWV
jgi:hypothetical protein